MDEKPPVIQVVEAVQKLTNDEMRQVLEDRIHEACMYGSVGGPGG